MSEVEFKKHRVFRETEDVIFYDISVDESNAADLVVHTGAATSPPDDCDIVQNDKPTLWKMCYEDVRDCDFVLLYCEKQNEEQRGALVELGMAYGFGKPVYAVGTCKTIQPTKISDVAFTHYHDFHWLPTSDLEVGYKMAINRELNKLRKVG